jgi:hypothetical protein
LATILIYSLPLLVSFAFMPDNRRFDALDHSRILEFDTFYSRSTELVRKQAS